MIYLFDYPVEEGEHHELTSTMLEAFVIALDDAKPIKGEITIKICTKGGDHHYMLGAYDALRLCPHKTRAVGFGCVLSAGAFILQAATKRVLTKNCRFMMHYGSGEVNKDFVDVSKTYEDVLFSRIQEKNPDFSKKKFSKLMRDSVYLSAQEAVDLGLADEII